MQVSAEIRWFWPSLPNALKEWFCAGEGNFPSAGGGVQRIDQYLVDKDQRELGIKRRGGKSGVEIKGLVEIIKNALSCNFFNGDVEIWAKWTSECLAIPNWCTANITKRRWLRKFDSTGDKLQEIALGADEKPLSGGALPVSGCNVELTQLNSDMGNAAWTMAFESFGPLSNVVAILQSSANELKDRKPPSMPTGVLSSYPSWLTQLVVTSKKLVSGGQFRITENSPYYSDGLQQGRPPDGNVNSGVIVTIVGEEKGPYKKIRMPDGTEAYVDGAILETI